MTRNAVTRVAAWDRRQVRMASALGLTYGTGASNAAAVSAGASAQQFDLYYDAAKSVRPLACLVPGGGYSTLTADVTAQVIAWFFSIGFDVAVVYYRVDGGASHLCNINDSVGDAATFMQELATNTLPLGDIKATYGVDYNRVIWVGGSAGGGIGARMWAENLNGYGRHPLLYYCMSLDSRWDLQDAVLTNTLGPPYTSAFPAATNGIATPAASVGQVDAQGRSLDWNRWSEYYYLPLHRELYSSLNGCGSRLVLCIETADTALNPYHGIDLHTQLQALGISHDYLTTSVGTHGWPQFRISSAVQADVLSRIGLYAGMGRHLVSRQKVTRRVI